MQNTSASFTNQDKADLRSVNFGLLMSFPKTYNSIQTRAQAELPITRWGETIFHTSPITQEWDKYNYSDYTDRVIRIEWQRGVERLASVGSAIADIVLDNSDDYFSPGSSSDIGSYILPYRPIKIFAGWDRMLVPVFSGMTERMPVIDEKNKTASFHCIDFLYSLFNKSLNESALFINERVDSILEDLFAQFDVSSIQLELDQAYTTPPIAYFKKGDKFIDAMIKLMQAEQGRLYMDEEGVISFKNRQNYNDTSIFRFDMYTNIKEVKTRRQDDLINVIEVKGKVRSEQPNQPFWDLAQSIKVVANSSVEVWAEFTDLVTGVDSPVYVTNADTSSFTVNEQDDGSGSEDTTSVTLSSASLLSGTTYKMIFANSNSEDRYIIGLQLFATPAPVIKNIYIREQDDTSVSKYDERVITIDNDYFQNETEAQSFAKVGVRDYADFGDAQQVDVKGSPALQIDDTITLDIYNRIADYKITKYINRIVTPPNFEQTLLVKEFEAVNYFTIGVSLIGGTDQIHP